MHRTWALALVALAACGAPKLESATEGLDASPRALSFANAFIGYPQSQALLVENRGATTLDVKLELAAPFSADARAFELGAGESTKVQVSFAPTQAGAANAKLTLSADSLEPIAVALSGSAASAPVCSASDECHASSFDPAQAECVETLMPNGSACGAANQCLVGASCLAGACVGETRSCDDDDICTADACDPSQGCVHVASTSMCPPPPDACHVATCDRNSGCGIADAPDWTPCGSMSCTEAHVCFSGACLAVTPPDGMRCGDPTPCSAAPTCRSGSCIAPADGGAIPVLWSYTPPSGYWVLFPGVADSRGDIFWIDEPNGPDVGHSYLVSADRDGNIRYRVSAPMFDAAPLMPGLNLRLTNGVLFGLSAVGPNYPMSIAASGFSPDDGGLLWTSDLQAELRIDPRLRLQLGPSVFDGQTTLLVVVNGSNLSTCDPEHDAAWLAQVNIHSGATTGTRFHLPDMATSISALFRGPAGQLVGYVRGFDCRWRGQLTQQVGQLDVIGGWFDPYTDDEFPRAATGDVLLTTEELVAYQQDTEVPVLRRMDDGGLIGRAQSDAGAWSEWDANFIMGPAEGFGVQYSGGAGPGCDVALVGFSMPTGALRWRTPFATCFEGAPLLSNRASLMSVTYADARSRRYPDGHRLELDETRVDGGAGFSCQLGASSDFGTAYRGFNPVLRAGRLVLGGADAQLATESGAEVAAFALPGYDIADGGWVAPGGNMERNGYVP